MLSVACLYLMSITINPYNYRVRQKFNLLKAHMDALLNVSPPSDTLVSLQTFYGTLQSHIRALSALGKSTQSYGSLLTTSILNKLPPDVKMHMACDHYNASGQ